jgi:hypothetical protein
MNHRYCRVKYCSVALWAICFSMPVCSSATEDDPGVWLSFSMSDAFDSGGEATRWHYWIDAQARFFDPGSGAVQMLVRPAIGYRITDNMKGWLGYARFRTRSQAGTVAHENRYWQQLDWAAGRWNGGDISMRARLEQRSVSTGEDIGVVLRFVTKYERPIGKDGRHSLILGIEPFVHLRDTDWGGESGLVQNRAFIGMGWRLSESISIEAGYMNQYIWVDGGENRSFHHGVLNFNVR